LNVPSAFIVQTAPRELVHVPTSGPGAVGAVVAQAFTNRRKTPAKAIRRVGCIFMSSACLGANGRSSSDLGEDSLQRAFELRYKTLRDGRRFPHTQVSSEHPIASSDKKTFG
jgi:hypothetical protein